MRHEHAPHQGRVQYPRRTGRSEPRAQSSSSSVSAHASLVLCCTCAVYLASLSRMGAYFCFPQNTTHNAILTTADPSDLARHFPARVIACIRLRTWTLHRAFFIRDFLLFCPRLAMEPPSPDASRSFRPILPLPAGSRRPDDGEGRRKRQVVAAACEHCRARKIKVGLLSRSFRSFFSTSFNSTPSCSSPSHQLHD
jgi:hypothetical protein